jgi:hypothetical protein
MLRQNFGIPQTAGRWSSLARSVNSRTEGDRVRGKGAWRWISNRLAEEVDSREIDDFIAASVENGRQHEKAKTLGLLVGDRWRHRKLLT